MYVFMYVYNPNHLCTVCMYICMYVCMYVYFNELSSNMYVCMYVYTYICILKSQMNYFRLEFTGIRMRSEFLEWTTTTTHAVKTTSDITFPKSKS